MRALAFAIAVGLSACHGGASHNVEIAHVQAHAAAIGAPVPDGQVKNASGQTVALAALRGHQQTVVVFYRGFY